MVCVCVCECVFVGDCICGFAMMTFVFLALSFNKL